ncbi:hypothetical protein, partial [Streptomyces sp. NPDC004976]
MPEPDDADGREAIGTRTGRVLSFDEYPNPLRHACRSEAGAASGREETATVTIPLVVGVDGSEASL